jgi:hypothetical protein
LGHDPARWPIGFATLASPGLSGFPPEHWFHRLSAIVLCLSVSMGLILAVTAGRFSIVEGVTVYPCVGGRKTKGLTGIEKKKIF